MKLRSLYFLSALFVGACCMTSCEDGTGENTDDLETIYWNKSAAFQMQLKGKVNSVVVDDSLETYVFNQAGNLTSSTDTYSATEYIYSSGRLIRQITTHTYGGETSNKDTMNFTFGTSGKYLPLIMESEMVGLFKNLASIKYPWNSTTTFTASGDSMLMLSSQAQHNTMMGEYMNLPDTTGSITFNGGLFPVTIRTNYGLTSITYAADGRFLTIQENSFFRSKLTTYKSNSNYMLPVSVVGQYEYEETPSTTTYTYNDKEDLIYVDGSSTDEEYSDYVYDSKGNWTSRSYRTKYGQDSWSNKETETRVITYWE